MEDTDAHDKSVLGIKGDIFAIEEDDKDWVKGGAEDERIVIPWYPGSQRPLKKTLFILNDDKFPLKKAVVR